MFDNTEDEIIVNEVLSVLNVKYEKHKYFNDGAVSRVILLNDKYLIKQNKNLLSEIEFFKHNNIDMFQKLLYVEPNNTYLVYSFVEGKPMNDVSDPLDTINKVLKVTSSYTTYNKEGYGYFLQLVDSWDSFLRSEIEHSSRNTKDYISNPSLVNKCLDSLKKYKFTKKVIHGDFGTHNFIEKDGKLVGFIDPDTVIGDPLYDTLFAIVSNVDILQTITLESLYDLINEEKEKIYSMLVITLFSRISRCLKYHKEDIDIYMNYYNYLKGDKEYGIHI